MHENKPETLKEQISTEEQQPELQFPLNIEKLNPLPIPNLRILNF